MNKSRAWREIESKRNVRPKTARHLWDWVANFTGVRIPWEPVCCGHTAPFEFFARQVLDRPSLSLWHGPRGSGKSFLSAIDTHIASRFFPGMGTRILGGSLSQSGQIYEAMRGGIIDGKGRYGHSDADAIESLLKQTCYYRNGSEVAILAASETSVRGPHVPCLKLDEVDEIDDELRQHAMGIPMEKNGHRSSVLMTSTYHRVGGPMSQLIEQGRAGAFPVYTYCVFEVMERCPEERSGPNLEQCPDCPIMKWCHEDRGSHPSGLPKAKRSNGHYRIEDLVTKTAAVSGRVFESDYLCLKPQPAGAWFTMFDEPRHVTEAAEYDRRFPVHLAIDPGVHTGAVWFQMRPKPYGGGFNVTVFADYFYESLQAETAPPEKNAKAILQRTWELCGVGTQRMRVSMDKMIDSRNAAGPIVRAEYERLGCKGIHGLETWVQTPGSIQDTLQLVETLLKTADGTISLTIHPRCRHLISAMRTYIREKRGGQWQNRPAENQHPAEDLIDPLRCGLKLEMPEGRAVPPNFRTIHARNT